MYRDKGMNLHDHVHFSWNSGYVAHLDLDTCAGEAYKCFRLQLGHAPGVHHQPPPFYPILSSKARAHSARSNISEVSEYHFPPEQMSKLMEMMANL